VSVLHLVNNMAQDIVYQVFAYCPVKRLDSNTVASLRVFILDMAALTRHPLTKLLCPDSTALCNPHLYSLPVVVRHSLWSSSESRISFANSSAVTQICQLFCSMLFARATARYCKE
jgi:hypothetical protein